MINWIIENRAVIATVGLCIFPFILIPFYMLMVKGEDKKIEEEQKDVNKK